MNNLSFKYKTKIKQPLNNVFDFYSNPKNLNLLTPWFAKVSCTPGKKISRNEVCPATEKKFKHCCGSL